MIFNMLELRMSAGRGYNIYNECNVFRLPVSLQVAIEFVLSFKFFGTLKTSFLQNGTAGDG